MRTSLKEILSVLTRKGQVTVPAEIRRAMGLELGDKVAFFVDEGGVRLVRAGSVVERTKGAVKSTLPPMTAEEMRTAAADAIADGVAERSR